MIQRVQNFLFFFAAIFLIIIVYNYPVLEDETTSYLLKEYFPYVRLFVFLSAALSIFGISQYRMRVRQKLIASFSRLMITISVLLIIFLHKEDKFLGIGAVLLIVPFITLLAANFFINRDEKLIKSADRIR